MRHSPGMRSLISEAGLVTRFTVDIKSVSEMDSFRESPHPQTLLPLAQLTIVFFIPIHTIPCHKPLSASLTSLADTNLPLPHCRVSNPFISLSRPAIIQAQPISMTQVISPTQVSVLTWGALLILQLQCTHGWRWWIMLVYYPQHLPHLLPHLPI